MKNHYQVLEVDQDASQEQIQEQYRFLVQAWHPDKFSRADQKAAAEEKTKQINAAYDVLHNPARRAGYDQKLQSSKKAKDRQQPPTQVQSQPAPHHLVHTPPLKKAPVRSRGLFPLIGASSRDLQAPQESIRVFINGRPRFLNVDELVGARVEYFLNGESKGMLDFKSRQHVKAAANRVAGPNGYDIHVLRLPPYKGRPELMFTPKARTTPRR